MQTTPQQLAVTVAINTWKLFVERANKLFTSLSDTQLLQEIAPGKNRIVYLLGHLTAVHDAMIPLLGFGDRLHPELDATFITNPDNAALQIPSTEQLKGYWEEVNGQLLSQFTNLPADEWLQRHSAMTDEDYAKDPTRNRLAVLMSRTNHVAYHLGQLVLAPR